MKKAATRTVPSYHEHIFSSNKRHLQDTTVSVRGYVFDGSEMRIRIHQVEKELIEARASLYGNSSELIHIGK